MGGDSETRWEQDQALRDQVVERAKAAGLRLVRFLYCDNDGVIRGKATGMSGLARRLQTGIGLTVAMQAFSLLDHLAPVEGMGPVGEIRLVPDPQTFVVAPYSVATGVVLVDMLTLEGAPYDTDVPMFPTIGLASAAGAANAKNSGPTGESRSLRGNPSRIGEIQGQRRGQRRQIQELDLSLLAAEL